MVKRRVCPLLLIALLSIPTAAHAQTRMALSGGVAISKLTGHDVSDFQDLRTRRGIYVNGAADIPLLGGGILSVSPGATYVDRGFTFGDTSIESAIKLSYLQIVAPLRVSVPVAGPLGVHVFGGPGFGLSFGCLFSRRQPNSITTVDCTNDEFQFKSIDVTGLLGAGLSFLLPNETRITLNGALDTSLKSIDSSEQNQDIRHRSLIISAGVIYPIQR
jgi:hypothetical protein